MASYLPRKRTQSAPAALRAGAQADVLKQRQADTKNATAQKAGYKNYGQQRSELVHQRNATRKAAKLGTVTTGYKRPKPKKPRFGAKDYVDNQTLARTQVRAARLGKSLKGVNFNDGITGAEARRVKYARARQKSKLTSGPRPV